MATNDYRSKVSFWESGVLPTQNIGIIYVLDQGFYEWDATANAGAGGYRQGREARDLLAHIADNTGNAHLPVTSSMAGFMTPDLFNKLAGIANNANNYVHPNSGITAGAYDNVTVNAQGHVTAGATVFQALVTATSAGGTANAVTTNTNTFLNVVQSKGGVLTVPGSSAQITGSGTVTVASDATGKITITGAQDITGNAATATALQTARTIQTNLGSTTAASFNGTANVTPGVTGTLPVANGGTGATTAAAALTNLGAAASARNINTGTGLSGGGNLTADRTLSIANTTVTAGSYGGTTQVPTFTVNAQGQLTAAGVATITPDWSNITGTPTTLAGYGITDAQPLNANLTALANIGATQGIYVSTGAGTATVRSVAAGTGISVANGNGVSGNPTITNTGVVSVAGTANQVTASAATGAVTLSLPQNIHSGATPTFAQVTVAADPSAALGVATKQYVDNMAAGLDVKTSVVVATTANITLSGTQTIDGIAVVAGNRVLVKDQTTAAQNGIYTVAAGAWARTTDADTWNELTSAFCFVERGTTQADTGWVCIIDQGGTLGTTAVNWTQFAGVGVITAGQGITVSGNQVALTNSGVTAGTYTKLTVDAMGRVTGGSGMVAADVPNLDWSKITTGKPTTLAGYGITDSTINTRQVIAGNGLTGGGNFQADRTITLGTPGTVTGSSTNATTSTSHTHALTVSSADLTDSASLILAQGIVTGTDLNTLQSRGIYWQTANVNATLALNYPDTAAGTLLVLDSGSSITTQMYTHYNNGNSWIRSRYNTTWTPWRINVMGDRQVIAGNGMTGGGALSADVTVTMGTPSTLSGSTSNATTSTSHTHALAAATTALAGVSMLATDAEAVTGTNTTKSVTPANVSAIHAAMTLTAGVGLTGGGTLAADRTFAMGTPSTLSGSTSNSATGTTHTHAISAATTTVSGVSALATDAETIAGTVTTKSVTPANVKALNASVVLTAGNGLTGGGDVTASRSFALGTPSTLDGATTNAVTATSHTHALAAASTTVSGVNMLATDAETIAGTVTTKSITPANLLAHDTALVLTAGNGLSGGGNLSASRTITLGTPTTLSGSTTNAVTTTSHTHAISAASETVSGVSEIATQAETDAGTDDVRTVTPKKLAKALGDHVPTGTISLYPLSTTPYGYLKCNGAAVSRTTYAKLFAVIGTIYGAGDGSTTFNVPDTRGQFLRYWADGVGRDSARTIGSRQGGTLISQYAGDLSVGAGHSLGDMEWNNTASGFTKFRMGDGAYGNGCDFFHPRPDNVAFLGIIKYL